jgi:hypothetical protein
VLKILYCSTKAQLIAGQLMQREEPVHMVTACFRISRVSSSVSAFSVTMLTILGMNAAASVILVPAEQPTIQEGINAANNGDIVIVSPGIYFERINFNGKAIAIQSVAGPTKTAIDGSNMGSGLRGVYHSARTDAELLQH